MRWSEEDTMKFIEMYKEHECLWNKCNPYYKNKNMREAAEMSMVQEMGKDGFGVNELKQKVKNLRCTYNQELIKIRRSAIAQGKVYTPSLKWFSIMDTMMKELKAMKEKEDLEALQNSEQPSGSIDEAMIQVCLTESTSGTGVQMNKAGTSPRKGAPKRINKRPPGMKDPMKPRRKVPEAVTKQDNTLNDNETFSKFVLSSLNKLGPREAILAQGDIQQILQRYRLHSMPQSSCASWNSPPYSAASVSGSIAHPLEYSNTHHPQDTRTHHPEHSESHLIPSVRLHLDENTQQITGQQSARSHSDSILRSAWSMS